MNKNQFFEDIFSSYVNLISVRLLFGSEMSKKLIIFPDFNNQP